MQSERKRFLIITFLDQEIVYDIDSLCIYIYICSNTFTCQSEEQVLESTKLPASKKLVMDW